MEYARSTKYVLEVVSNILPTSDSRKLSDWLLGHPTSEVLSVAIISRLGKRTKRLNF
jgi:hypothetical protein